MARKRAKEIVLKSWDDANKNLMEIAALEIELEAIEGDLNKAIAQLKVVAERTAKPLNDKKDLLTQQVKEFTEENRADIKGKTMKLNFGSVGFRASNEIVIKSVEATLKSLKALGMTKCINTKETVNREALKDYPDEVIASVGARKRLKDTFWYETDREKLTTP